MARVVKEDEYNARRNEILDIALNLVYTKGYAQMTIQDILDGLQISRGALYHYFDSKQALLEALVDRMGKAAEQTLLPIVRDPHLSAIEKFRAYFEASSSWKTMQKPLIISLLRMWYTDDNALIRQKMAEESLKHTASILEPMIRQGIDEKVFTTAYPEQVAKIISGVALSLTDIIVGLLVSSNPAQPDLQKYKIAIDAYFDTIERILGAPAGSLKSYDADVFKDWFTALQPDPAST